MHPIEIYPSILAADFSNLSEGLKTVESAGADGFHFDVMDGHYVDNITFGPVVLESIRKVTGLPFWVHLMICDPEKYADDFIAAGADGLFIHPDTVSDMNGFVQKLKDKGVHVGMALNPDTDVHELRHLFHLFSDMLIMLVHPGFGGQKMIGSALDQIHTIETLIGDSADRPRFHVDGGVNESTVQQVLEAGADTLVAGSGIFRQRDPAHALQLIRSHAKMHLERMKQT
ncbi:ribulose-phosphate 3-epimerase [bacterium]|nr:ribulose-phosphate 3-epimerase [bacterium]